MLFRNISLPDYCRDSDNINAILLSFFCGNPRKERDISAQDLEMIHPEILVEIDNRWAWINQLRVSLINECQQTSSDRVTDFRFHYIREKLNLMPLAEKNDYLYNIGSKISYSLLEVKVDFSLLYELFFWVSHVQEISEEQCLVLVDVLSAFTTFCTRKYLIAEAAMCGLIALKLQKYTTVTFIPEITSWIQYVQTTKGSFYLQYPFIQDEGTSDLNQEIRNNFYCLWYLIEINEVK